MPSKLFISMQTSFRTEPYPFAVATILLRIEDLGLANQGVDLLLRLLFRPERALVTHGLVFGGIGVYLGAIQCNMALSGLTPQQCLQRLLIAE